MLRVEHDRVSGGSDARVPPHDELGLGKLEAAFEKTLTAQGLHKRIQAALKEQKLERKPTETLLERAVAANVLTAAERTQIEEAERARALAIAVDSFPKRGAKAKSA